MKKDKLLELGLDEEAAGRVAATSAEELRGFVPQARLNEVIGERDAARQELAAAQSAVKERDGQLEELRKSNGDAEALRSTIEQLQRENREKDQAHAAEVTRLKVSAAVDAALSAAGARNLKAARALLELEKAELDKDGAVKGLDKQIEALKSGADTGFLFAPDKPSIRGARAGENGVDDGDGKADLAAMSYTELCAYLETHPEAQL